MVHHTANVALTILLAEFLLALGLMFVWPKSTCQHIGFPPIFFVELCK